MFAAFQKTQSVASFSRQTMMGYCKTGTALFGVTHRMETGSGIG